MNQAALFNLTDTLTGAKTAGLFTSLCTIKRPARNVDALGQVDLTTVTAVAGLSNIPCMRSVLSEYKPNPYYETKTEGQINQLNINHVLLNGYYTGILQGDQAVVDGIPLEVLNVESDSQRIMTRLAVRVYSL